MKKKILLLMVGGIVTFFSFFSLFQYIRIKTAKIEVTLKKNRQVEFNSKAKVSDFIKSMNGKLKKDEEIDTTKLGKKEVKFQFINDDNIMVSYQYDIEVVDTVEPLIWLTSTYSVVKDSDINLVDQILCGDNYDERPKCYIEGEYDLTTVGDYSLVFKAEDSSGNKEQMPFTLKVYEKENKIEWKKQKENT